MPTEFVEPDDNRHEGWCSGDWTLGMISDKVDHDSGDDGWQCSSEQQTLSHNRCLVFEAFRARDSGLFFILSAPDLE